MAKKREIRNSTAEFLTFVAEGKENGIQVLYKDETIWATQKAMATLFDVGVPAINKHLKNIFDSGELMADSVISKMETTASDGKIYQTAFYNLDAIISVGYRVNSIRATQFRQWCTYVIRQFSLRGYIID
ncbi:MAG: virulence RhuM family protein, partial [Prevotella sp.]